MTQHTDETIAIPLDDLIRVFQINDPSLFQQPSDDDMHKYIANSLYALDGLNSSIPQAFEAADAKDTALYRYESSKGGTIILRLFSFNSDDGKQNDFVTMTIMQMVKKDDEQIPQPIFSFTGRIIDQSVVAIAEARALYPVRGDDSNVVGPNNDTEFKAFLIYADACFTMALQGKEMSVSDISHLLSDKKIAEAPAQFEILRHRTKFDTNMIINHKQAEDDRYVIDQDDITNIFQLKNKHIYHPITYEDYKNIHPQIFEFLQAIDSQYTPHFEEGVTFIEHPLSLSNENGDSLWSISYSFEDAFGISRDYSLILIAMADQHEGEEHSYSKPLALLLGEIDRQKAQYIPLEAICRTKDNADAKPYDFYTSLETLNGLEAALCYAEAAMGTLILQKNLAPEHLSKWITSGDDWQVGERYGHICSRSAQALTFELKDLEDNQHFAEPPSIAEQRMPPPGYILN